MQPTCSPVNDHVMELLILLDAFRRSSASRITAVMPYFGYARQDKKDKPRVPIAAKLMADLLTAAGAAFLAALTVIVLLRRRRSEPAVARVVLRTASRSDEFTRRSCR